MEQKLEKLEQKIGYKFKNIKYLKTALTHTSYANERKIQSNEKLEFLGDSVLGLVASTHIYNNYKELTEGEMTKVKASVVCSESLYNIAVKLNFSDFLYMGKAEKNSRIHKKKAILEDSIEAVIAAIYLDGGIEEAQKFILSNIVEEIKTASQNAGIKDYKTVLQEELQKNGEIQIEYIVIKETGPDHAKTFEVELCVEGKIISKGIGKSKKEAQMKAAKVALEKMERN